MGGSRCRSIDEGDDERNTNVLFFAQCELHNGNCSRLHLHSVHKPANVGRDDNEWLVVKHLIENDFVELGEPCILECNLNESECQKCIKENQ